MELSELKEKMTKTIDNMNDQLRGLHTGYIEAGLIDTIKVEYHGQQVPIQQVAQTANTQNGISVRPYESDLCGKIIAAIKRAGLNPYQFSKEVVMVNRPAPSGDDKKKVIAQVNKLAEEAKVAIRQVRQNFRKQLTGSGLDQNVINANKIVDHLAKGAESMIEKAISEKINRF